MRRIEFKEKDLERLYLKEGLSLRGIAKLYSCDPGAVARALRRFEITVREPRKVLAIDPGKLRKLYIEDGLSTYSIAELYGCDPKTIYLHLKRNGIQSRAKEQIPLSRDNLISLYKYEGKSLHAIAAQYGYSAAGILKKCREYGIERRTISETSTKHPKHDFNGSEEEKAYMIGFRIGDLGIRERKNLIYVSSGTTKKAQVELIKSLFSPYGPVWVGKPNSKGALNVSASVNRSFSFLLPKHRSVPRWILESRACFFSFLAGYADAEGNFMVVNNNARFRLRSYDLGILNDLHNGLSKYGIPSTYRLDKKAGVYGKGVKHNQDSWCLAIAQKEALKRLLDTLGPLLRHQKRKEDAIRVMENVARRLA